MIGLIYAFLKKGSSINEMNINPIDTISFEGCMGFKLGDSYEFVLSRIDHLNLMNSAEKEDFELMKIYKNITLPITTSSNLFNNIKNVSFHFNNFNQLSGILIKLTDVDTDKQTLISVITKRLNIKGLGEGIDYISMTYWKMNNRIIGFEKGDKFYLSINEK